ncbi:MAG TPA: protein kinase [Pyrinomonadaceae bacterium]|nr:protein kinase [Pyrinomonadaceae bacterium]
MATVGVCAKSYLALTSPMFFNPDDYGFGVRQQVGRLVVVLINPSGPAAALQNGDELVSVDGEYIRYQTDLITAFRRHPPETSYSIVLRREEQLLHLTMRQHTPSLGFYIRRLILFLVPVSFFFMGLFVFLLKPDDKPALLLCLWFGAISTGYPEQLYLLLPGWVLWAVVASSILKWFLIPLCVHFFLIFPEASPLLRRWPRLESQAYVPYLLVILPFTTTMSVLWAISPDRGVAFSETFPLFSQATYLVGLAYFATGILLLVLTYRRASLPSRRKMRVFVTGTIAGFLPVFMWFAVTLLFANTPVGIWLYSWPFPAVVAAQLLVPPAYAYAILRHRVIPISLIIRRGVQYLFAKNVLRLLIALPILGLIVTVLSNPERTLSDILFRNSLYFYVTLLIAAAILFLIRRRLNDWIDRKFFREHYNQENILRGLIEDVKKYDSVPDMSRLVSRKVESALHPERIYLFYRDEESRDLSLGYSTREAPEGLRIPEEFRLIRLMEDHVGAQDFPFPQKKNLPGGEEEWLARLGTRLIVPLVGTDDRLAGLFLLGEKKSEVPYTARDRNLLESLAGQVALVYENTQLKDRVDRERKIKHEVLGRFEERHINLMKECTRCGACFDSSATTCDKDGSELTLSMPVERTIDGRYRLERLVGRGGMGAVYEATDLRLNRRVAVKILSGKMFGNREALRRFEREAQTSARLSHRNIISVYDYGVLAAEGAYLVMELISGETLAALIKREGCVAPQAAAECFNQVLEGIKAAHAAGVIHRDLKPANVLISKEENGQLHVRVLDFGLAKITLSELTDTNSPTALLTTPGMVVGTMGYMSPEQLRGETVDERSDLFSVGVMVVEVLTGSRPFRGPTYTELLSSILHGSFHLEGGSKEAEQLDAVLQKCLAKDRERRFSSAGEMQRELIPAMREYRLVGTQKWSSAEADTLLY